MDFGIMLLTVRTCARLCIGGVCQGGVGVDKYRSNKRGQRRVRAGS